MKRQIFYARTSKDEIEDLRRSLMAKDPTIGPVTLYDAFGNPINPAATSSEPTEEAAIVDLPAMRTTLESMKMPALRAFAEDIGLKSARSKAETIERLMDAMAKGVQSEGLPDDWQAPPLPIPLPRPGDSPFGSAYPPIPQEVQKSVRVRRIEEAGGKKGG